VRELRTAREFAEKYYAEGRQLAAHAFVPQQSHALA
jgi:hypothetical protein